MTLSPAEKETLIGSTLLGCLLGAAVAYAIFAFASESSLQSGQPINPWQAGAQAAVGFLLATASSVGFLGVLPVVFQRWRKKSNP